MELKEPMVYKNLINRLFFSLFFFAIYLMSLKDILLLFFLGTVIYFFVFYEVLKFFNKYFKLILFYLLFSYFCFSLYFLIFYDFIIFNLFISIIIIFDSFSFVTGKFFGKNFIFKTISPKKTLEGYIGGFFFTNAFLFGYFYFAYI